MGWATSNRILVLATIAASSFFWGLTMAAGRSNMMNVNENKNMNRGGPFWWPGPWGYNWKYNDTDCPFSSHRNRTRRGPSQVAVGGSMNWNFGFNYSDWALQNGPFFLNDVLVFKYKPALNGSGHNHSVYMLPDYWSYKNCDLRRGKRVAGPTQGMGEGFKFVLRRPWQTHYFACGESNGIHCKLGMMKFFVTPIFPFFY